MVLLQSLIIFAVCASNIHWHWTPNGYIPALAGAGLAWIATQIVVDIQTLRIRKRKDKA